MYCYCNLCTAYAICSLLLQSVYCLHAENGNPQHDGQAQHAASDQKAADQQQQQAPNQEHVVLDMHYGSDQHPHQTPAQDPHGLSSETQQTQRDLSGRSVQHIAHLPSGDQQNPMSAEAQQNVHPEQQDGQPRQPDGVPSQQQGHGRQQARHPRQQAGHPGQQAGHPRHPQTGIDSRQEQHQHEATADEEEPAGMHDSADSRTSAEARQFAAQRQTVRNLSQTHGSRSAHHHHQVCFGMVFPSPTLLCKPPLLPLLHIPGLCILVGTFLHRVFACTMCTSWPTLHVGRINTNVLQ